MREVPKSGPLVLKGGSADPPDPPGYGPVYKWPRVYLYLALVLDLCTGIFHILLLYFNMTKVGIFPDGFFKIRSQIKISKGESENTTYNDRQLFYLPKHTKNLT